MHVSLNTLVEGLSGKMVFEQHFQYKVDEAAQKEKAGNWVGLSFAKFVLCGENRHTLFHFLKDPFRKVQWMNLSCRICQYKLEQIFTAENR